MRPTSLDEVAGQRTCCGPARRSSRSPRPDASTGAAVSVILWGPPGTGKTTLAQAIARSSGRRFVELSAVTAGVTRRARGHAGGADPARPLRPVRRFCSSTRSIASRRPSRTRCCPASRTAGSSSSPRRPRTRRSRSSRRCCRARCCSRSQPLTDDDLGMLLDRAVVRPPRTRRQRRARCPRPATRSSGSPRAMRGARSPRSRRRPRSPSRSPESPMTRTTRATTHP